MTVNEGQYWVSEPDNFEPSLRILKEYGGKYVRRGVNDRCQ